MILPSSERIRAKNKIFLVVFFPPFSFTTAEGSKHLDNGPSLFVYRNVFWFEEGWKPEKKKKIAVIAVDVIRHSDGQRKATRRLCGCEKKRRMVVYRVRFHFSLLPLFCLPFDLFYIDFFFVTGLCVCVVVGAFTIEERRPSREWPLGSRTTRSSSINNGLARRVHETSRNRPSVILFFLLPSSFSSSLYAILGWFSFHSFKTQHATIIQHSSTVGASLFGFAATSESREKDDGGLLGESLRATGESGRAWESSRLGESVTAIVVIQKRKTLKSGGRQRETQRMVTLVSPWDRQRGGQPRRRRRRRFDRPW